MVLLTMSAESDIKKPAEALLRLCEYLNLVSTEAKSRIECYKELFEQEYIHDEMYERLVDNERLGLLAEIDNFINYYRSIN